MTGDDYRPREHDHLVEPMFGGLGVERDRPAAAPATGLRAFLRRLWRACLASLGRRA